MLSDCLLCPFLLIITGGKPDKQAYVFLQARSSPFKESTGLEWTADEELGINCRHSERSLVMSLICVRPFLPINLSTLPGDSPAILSARTHTHTHARTQAHTHTHIHTHRALFSCVIYFTFVMQMSFRGEYEFILYIILYSFTMEQIRKNGKITYSVNGVPCSVLWRINAIHSVLLVV